MTTQNIRLTGIIVTIAVLLLVAFASMRLTGAPNWSRFDFTLVGVLLLVTGLAVEFVLRTVRSFRNRLAICAAILFVLLLVWAELAVGLFGTRFAGS